MLELCAFVTDYYVILAVELIICWNDHYYRGLPGRLATSMYRPGLLHPNAGKVTYFGVLHLPHSRPSWQMKYHLLAERWKARRKYTWDNIEQTCLDSFFFLFLYAQVIQGEKGILYSIGHRWQSRCCLSPTWSLVWLDENNTWRA